MERITKQLTTVRTIAVSLVLVAAVFGVPLVGAQKTDGDSSSSDGGSRTVIKADKPSDDGGGGDTGGNGDTGDTGDTEPSTTGGSTDSGDSKPSGGTVTTPDTQPTSMPDTCPHGGAWNDIRDANGDCFDGGGPTVTNISVSNNRATVTVRNVGTQDYLVHLASYEAPLPHGHPDYIEAQTLFQSRTSNMVPGQQLTFSVPVPACGNYQVDLFTGDEVPAANPDFGAPPLSLTHTLFDWITEHEGEPCVPQCPQTPPAIYTQTNAVGVVGQEFTHNITITDAVYPAGIGLEGVLPAGLAFSRVQGNQYVISGTPTQATTGSDFTITAFNPCGEASTTIRIVITGGSCPIPAPFITSPTTATAIAGQQFSYTVTTSGGPSTISVGQLPSWLTYNPITHVISGTAPSTNAIYTAIITASNECATASINLTITVTGGQCDIEPPVITSPTSASGVVGEDFTYTITASGKASFTVSGLPAGLTLNGNVISGTPTQAGTFTAIVTATNPCGSAVINLVITITDNQCPIDPPLITSATTASARVDVPFTYEVTYSGKAEITVGQLPSWLSFDPTTNTLSGTPTQRGSHTVVITASNQCGTAVINLVITVGGGGGSCPVEPPFITSSTTASGKVGSSFTYTITTTGTVDDITVAGLPAGLALNGSVISGTPTQEGTFTAIISAENECGVATINLVITINDGGDDDDDDDDGGCSGSCGGGRPRPKVVLFSQPDVLGASISLAQVPYTGLGTSILQLVLFILGLLAISGGIIYMIMRRFGNGGDAYTAFSAPVSPAPRPSTDSVDAEDEPMPAAYEEYARSMPVVAPAPTPAPVAQQYVPENIPVAPVAQTAPRVVAPMAAPQAPAVRAEVSVERIQTEARSARALISDDGAELLANSAEGDEKKALERMTQVIDIAKTRYPREDGWLILDKDRVREALFISTLSMIPLFVEWVVRGEDKKVFTFLRMLKHQEQPVGDFMRKVVSEFDTAHRARMEGGDAQTKVNAHVAEVTYHLSNKDLESIVGELLHGVDERYDSAYTSVRLSLVRVLDLVKERSLRAAGAPYAFEA